jgi:phosphatidylglycerophosphatase A
LTGGYKRRMNFLDRAALMLAKGFGAGSSPLAPGTIGSLWGILLGYAMARCALAATLAIAVGVVLIGVWAAGRAERLIGKKDAPEIVVDEVAGMTITLAGLPFTLPHVAAGFIIFRMLDIAKPPPARWAEEHMVGGWGVVMDDVVAGVYGNLLLRAGALLFSRFPAAWN